MPSPRFCGNFHEPLKLRTGIRRPGTGVVTRSPSAWASARANCNPIIAETLPVKYIDIERGPAGSTRFSLTQLQPIATGSAIHAVGGIELVRCRRPEADRRGIVSADGDGPRLRPSVASLRGPGPPSQRRVRRPGWGLPAPRGRGRGGGGGGRGRRCRSPALRACLYGKPRQVVPARPALATPPSPFERYPAADPDRGSEWNGDHQCVNDAARPDRREKDRMVSRAALADPNAVLPEIVVICLFLHIAGANHRPPRSDGDRQDCSAPRPLRPRGDVPFPRRLLRPAIHLPILARIALRSFYRDDHLLTARHRPHRQYLRVLLNQSVERPSRQHLTYARRRSPGEACGRDELDQEADRKTNRQHSPPAAHARMCPWSSDSNASLYR